MIGWKTGSGRCRTSVSTSGCPWPRSTRGVVPGPGHPGDGWASGCATGRRMFVTGWNRCPPRCGRREAPGAGGARGGVPGSGRSGSSRCDGAVPRLRRSDAPAEAVGGDVRGSASARAERAGRCPALHPRRGVHLAEHLGGRRPCLVGHVRKPGRAWEPVAVHAGLVPARRRSAHRPGRRGPAPGRGHHGTARPVRASGARGQGVRDGEAVSAGALGHLRPAGSPRRAGGEPGPGSPRSSSIAIGSRGP